MLTFSLMAGAVAACSPRSHETPGFAVEVGSSLDRFGFAAMPVSSPGFDSRAAATGRILARHFAENYPSSVDLQPDFNYLDSDTQEKFAAQAAFMRAHPYLSFQISPTDPDHHLRPTQISLLRNFLVEQGVRSHQLEFGRAENNLHLALVESSSGISTVKLVTEIRF